LRIAFLKQRRLVIELIGFAFSRETGADQFLQPKFFKILRKEFGEVAPLRVVARQQDRFPPKHVRVVFQIRHDFLFDVVVLRIEFVEFCLFSFREFCVCHGLSNQLIKRICLVEFIFLSFFHFVIFRYMKDILSKVEKQQLCKTAKQIKKLMLLI